MGTDLDVLLGEARLPEKTVELCLRGDLVAEVEDLERRLAAAQAADRPGMLTSGAEARRLAEQIEQLRTQMRDASVTFRLRAMHRREWRALLDAHPPRRDEHGQLLQQDTIGLNSATFFDALIRASVVEPQLTDQQWELLFDRLTSRQYDDLHSTAWRLNRNEVDVPFSHAASAILRTSEPE